MDTVALLKKRLSISNSVIDNFSFLKMTYVYISILLRANQTNVRYAEKDVLL
ncbi:MAG: hypothetical protein ACI4VX_02940 [Succinivibrionaceae bacterium]